MFFLRSSVRKVNLFEVGRQFLKTVHVSACVPSTMCDYKLGGWGYDRKRW